MKEIINRSENMGVLDKFLNVMRLNPEDDDDFTMKITITMMIIQRTSQSRHSVARRNVKQ